jgi:hypothetical protein
MKALVVYESMFGNTEKVAAAVAHGLQLEDVDTGLVEIGSATTHIASDVDLLVVGAPTHAFALSRPGSRADAVRQGAPPERTRVGLREWLESVGFDAERPPLLMAFDTRVTKVRWLPAAAGASAVHLARRRGLATVGKPVGFLVDDVRGPLVDGELERATTWGRHLGTVAGERISAREVTERG